MMRSRSHDHQHLGEGRLIRRWAWIYDPVTWAMTLGRVGAVRKTAIAVGRLPEGAVVLDIGCGTGALAFAAQKATPSAKVFGIDASPEMIAVARSKARRRSAAIQFEVASVAALPFPDARFDAVLSSFMLHHLPPDVRASGLAEVHRVLKPGGRFVAADFSSAAGGLLGHLAAVLGHGHSQQAVTELLAAVERAGFRRTDTVKTRHRSMVFVRARK